MPYPILAANSSWYKGTMARSTITEIDIVNTYTPTGSETETWNADVDNTGDIKCYVTGTKLTIAGNGSGKVFANPNSSYAFSSTGSDLFSALTTINGGNLLDTSKATNMQAMFNKAVKLTTLDVSNWNVSNVTNMQQMFAAASGSSMAIKSLDVSNWDVGNVTNMFGTFAYCGSLTDLDVTNWNTGKVDSMYFTFAQCTSLKNLNVSKWNTSSVTTMNSMFQNCNSLESLDVSNWNTAKVTVMSYMFQDCHTLQALDVSKWNTGAVTNFRSIFNNCYKLVLAGVGNWNTGNANNMLYMFQHCDSLTQLDLSKWNVSNVKQMDSMFVSCENLTELNLSGWNTSKVTGTGNMFAHCPNLKTIYVSDDWTTAAVTRSADMFLGCTSLVGGNGTAYDASHIDYVYAQIDGKNGNPGYLTDIQDSYELLIRTGTLRKIGTGIRKINGDTSKYYPSEMAGTLNSVNMELLTQADIIEQIISILTEKFGQNTNNI